LDQYADQDVTHPDWASRLAAAIELQLKAIQRPGEARVQSIRATQPDEIEVVYSVPEDPRHRGIRISADLVRSAPARIRESTIDELAFDIVTTGILEPRAQGDFLPADPNGVMWLSIPDWLEEIT
jgi:hypothetical protein